MLYNHSYKAKVEGNILTWPEGTPSELKDGRKHDVLVIVPPAERNNGKGNGAELAAILEQIAATGLITEKWVNEWEEANRDRPLRGREE